MPDDDDYTIEPTHLRVFIEEYPDLGPTFNIDGADDEGRYTEDCWSGYSTIADALGDAEQFIAATTRDGVKWCWDTSRPRGIRRAPRWGGGTEGR